MTGPRVVMYGVDAMGSVAARMILEKGGEIVGAIARSPAKLGRDIAEVAGRPAPLGVPVRADATELLRETRPDIVVMTIASYMATCMTPVRICLDEGVDVLSLSEELLYSWQTSADRTASSTPKAWVATAVRPPTFGRTTLHSVAAVAGLTVTDSETSTRPEVATAPVECRALGLTVEPGRLIGFTDVDTVRTAEGPVLALEMTGKVYSDGDNDGNHWTVIGEPTVELHNDVLPTHLTTCSTLVNRIPDVLAAEPGYRTLDQLPLLRFRSRL